MPSFSSWDTVSGSAVRQHGLISRLWAARAAVLSGAYLKDCGESGNSSCLPAAGHWRGRPLSGAGTASACEACWRQAPQTGDSSKPDVCEARRGSTEARLKRPERGRDDGYYRGQAAEKQSVTQHKLKHRGFVETEDLSAKHRSRFSGPGWTAPPGSRRWHGLRWSGALVAGSARKYLQPSLWGCRLHRPHLREQQHIRLRSRREVQIHPRHAEWFITSLQFWCTCSHLG